MRKGQLVRSRKYGDLYVVDIQAAHRGEVWCRPLSPKRFCSRPSDTFLFEETRLELIGNNYRTKGRKGR